jgi:alkanesulfonate monooxygenase
MQNESAIEILSTTPQSKDRPRDSYLQQVIDVAQWSEGAGCTGILVYTDNSLVDPWLISQVILQNTDKIAPLVAIQPAYMHPYAAAKMVATLGYLYNRQIYLNMVAGGFRNDLIALNDTTPHDERYVRLVEYTTIIRNLLSKPGLLSFQGKFYKVSNLKMTPPLDPALVPRIFISGSSDAGMAAAAAIGATPVIYPKQAKAHEPEDSPQSDRGGVRVGIIARENRAEAWAAANERFPGDRKGQLAHELAMRTSDSEWHKQLSGLAEDVRGTGDVYWMWPFENYQTFCPYLVGSYDEVAEELARYIRTGYRTFILDIPPTREELRHTNIAFDYASQGVAR